MLNFRSSLLLLLLPAFASPSLAETGTSLSLTLTTTTLTLDADADGRTDAGDRLQFTGAVSSIGTVPATSITLTIPADPNLTATSILSNPIAIDDAVSTDEETPLNLAAPGVLANDFDLPQPSALSVSATTRTGLLGQANIFPAGALRYNPNQNFESLPLGKSTSETLTYEVRDAHDNTDTATLVITINGRNDIPAATAQAVSTDEDTPLQITLTGTDVDAGTTLTFAIAAAPEHGTLSAITPLTATSARVTFTPGSPFQDLAQGATRAASFTFTVNDGIGTSPAATVGITVNGVNDAPVPVTEIYAAIGNTTLEVGGTAGNSGATVHTRIAAGNLLLNDTDPDAATTLQAVAETVASTKGGSVVIRANGSFYYAPPAGLTSTSDTFTYKVSDGIVSVPQAVTINLTGKLWYIHNGVAGPGNGTSQTPFTTLATFNTANNPAVNIPPALQPQNNDSIYIFNTGTAYPGGIALRTGQTLIGNGEALNISGVTRDAATHPVISNAAGAGITLASGNTVKGLHVSGTTGYAILGSAVGNLTISNTSVLNSGTNGGALSLNSAPGGTVNATFATLSSGTGATNAVSLTNINGTVTAPAGSLPKSSGANFLVTGGTANITYGGTITGIDANPVNISSKSGGTVAFSGAISGTGSGILLADNTGAVINFTGGLTLSTGTNHAFTATGGGTISVTGDTNTITCSSATALKVENTLIGANNLNFRSISSTGGSATGIILDTTGNIGRLIVTGTGTPGSGGTIAQKAGADGTTANGIGIYINDSDNASFSRMQLNTFDNFAIRGVNAIGFTLNNSVINGLSGNNVGLDEGAVSFDGLTGTAVFSQCTIQGGAEDNVRIHNTSDALNSAQFTGCTFGATGISGNDAILISGAGTATMNATVQNSTFTASRANHIAYVMNNSAGGNFQCSSNTMSNNHPNKLGSDFGIIAASTSSAPVTYQVTGNTVRDAGGSAIEVDRLAGGAGSMTGTISNNIIGVSGLAGSGSFAGSGIFVGLVGSGTAATHTSTISNNTIYQFENYGINLTNRGTGAGYLNATVIGNNISQPNAHAVTTGFPTSGIRVNLGSSSTGPDDGKTCLDIRQNIVNRTASSISSEIRIFGRFATKTAIIGLAGDPNAFINSLNTITLAPGALSNVNATSTNPFQSNCPPF